MRTSVQRANRPRFTVAAVLIALTAIFLQARSRTEVIPQRLPLSSFPTQLAGWDSSEIVQDKQTLEVLGPGDFMERVYQDPNGKLPYVDLFLAYFPSQRAGETPHSPQHCACPALDGNPDENVRVTLSRCLRYAPFPANPAMSSPGRPATPGFVMVLGGARSRCGQRILI